MVETIFERGTDGTGGPIKVRMSYRACVESITDIARYFSIYSYD